jgi:Sel1 repeat
MKPGKRPRCVSRTFSTQDSLASTDVRGTTMAVRQGWPVVSFGLVLLCGACANPRGGPDSFSGLPATFPAAGKTAQAYQADITNCRQFAIAHPASYGQVRVQASYAACMMSVGNSVQFPDGSIRSSQNFQSPQAARAPQGAQAWIMPGPSAEQQHLATEQRLAAICGRELPTLLKEDAESTDPAVLVSAREQIGECYQNGWGVPRDRAAARKWYEKALNTPGAMSTFDRTNLASPVRKASFLLSEMYEHGQGGPRDHAKAEELLASAGMQTREQMAEQRKRDELNAAIIAGALLAPVPATPSSEPSWMACHHAGGFAGVMNCPPWKQ